MDKVLKFIKKNSLTISIAILAIVVIRSILVPLILNFLYQNIYELGYIFSQIYGIVNFVVNICIFGLITIISYNLLYDFLYSIIKNKIASIIVSAFVGCLIYFVVASVSGIIFSLISGYGFNIRSILLSIPNSILNSIKLLTGITFIQNIINMFKGSYFGLLNLLNYLTYILPLLTLVLLIIYETKPELLKGEMNINTSYKRVPSYDNGIQNNAEYCYCYNCGNKCLKTQSFCTNCGTALRK